MVTIRSSSSVVISPALWPKVSPRFSFIPGEIWCDQPLVQVDIGFLADQVGVATADTLDAGQGVHDLLLAIDVGVEKTKDVLDCSSRLASCLWRRILCVLIQFDFSPLTRAV